MRLVVDTGVFSAALDRRGRTTFEGKVSQLSGNQLFLAPVTVVELRYGARVAGWGESRRDRLEAAIASTTVVPVTDPFLTQVADLRAACRRAGHPLGDKIHGNDLWIAATAVHLSAALLTTDGVFYDVPGLSLA